MPTKRFDHLDPARRAAILSAAASEFAASGFEGASYNRIIELAETSKGSMYYYFEDKADLYATVVRDAVERFVVACGPVRPVADVEAFWDQVRRLIRFSVQHYRVDPHLAGLVRSLAADGLEVVGIAQLRAMSADMWRSLVCTGRAVGAVRYDLPLDLSVSLAVRISEGIDAWLAERIDTLGEPELDALADTVLDLYRRLAAPPRRP